MRNTAIAALDREQDPFDELLGYHLRRLSVLVMADLADTLMPLGLKPATASIILMIGSNPGVTQSEIGRTLGILRANMAPLIAALVKQGLIDRKAVDGRSQALRLSATGRLVHREARAATLAHEDRIFGSLTNAFRAQMISQLRKLWQDKELARKFSD
jgi:DNA-binding MarR family transcriptional regulator